MKTNSALALDEKNANKGTKRGRELLEESLEKYGAGRSVVVDRHNRVIAGNKTVEAARAAGMESITVIETDGADFSLGSAASRAAARTLAESRESFTYQCSTCILTGLGVMDSNRPGFIPNEKMERGPEGWVWKCMKHKDPSKEATVQALTKSGLWAGPTL